MLCEHLTGNYSGWGWGRFRPNLVQAILKELMNVTKDLSWPEIVTKDVANKEQEFALDHGVGCITSIW